GMATSLPRDFSVPGAKVIVLVTQGYPIRYDFAGDGLNRRGLVDRAPEPVTDQDRIALATDHLQAMCEAIRSEGQVKVFVLGYDLPAATDATLRRARQVLTECPSNGGIYMDVARGELKDSIDRLIGEIRQVRLVE